MKKREKLRVYVELPVSKLIPSTLRVFYRLHVSFTLLGSGIALLDSPLNNHLKLFICSLPFSLHSLIFSSSISTIFFERGLCMYFRTLCLCLIASSIVMTSLMKFACKDKEKNNINGK